MNPNNVAAIKRHVTGGKLAPGQSASLELQADAEGVMWASNRYWISPAVRVTPLLTQFNLDPDKPGSYEVNGSIRPGGQLSADCNWTRHLDPVLYTMPVMPVLIAGKMQAYVSTDGGAFRAVYQATDGTVMSLAADQLDWLSSTYNLPHPEDSWYGAVRFLVSAKSKGARSVAIVADLLHRVSPAMHGTGPDGEGTTRGGETENLGPRVIGIMAGWVLEAGS